ncbi:MAG: MoaD/ThiS family protein [bacterium]|nr:MoaD/ThiS family protein [bacterium]
MNIKVTVFARLKDFFEPEFTLELPAGTSVAGAVEALSAQRPAAAEVLAASRAAVDDSFVPPGHLLEEGIELFLLPPSSGG